MEKIAFLPGGSISRVKISCCGTPLPGEDNMREVWPVP